MESHALNLLYFNHLQLQGIGTIAGVILPALYTRCTFLEEVGAYTLDGDEIRNLLVDSPDGYIRIDHKPNLPNCCHPDDFGFNNLDMTLEIKSPYPDPKSMPVHYSVPKYYILQMLANMKVTNLERNVYVSCGPKKCRSD